MIGRHLLRGVAAVALTAATSLVLPVGPASAAACSTARGVTVVVDFHQFGGVATGCVADGGGDTAASLFEVDHDLTRVQQYPGAVCKVDNTPADVACRNMPPSNAYWGLFWSDGSGGWVYSSEGVDSLDIPDGGSVAFAWQNGGGRDYPGVAPPQTAEEPSPSPSPSPTPDGSGGASGDGSNTPPSASPSSGTPGTPGTTGSADGVSASTGAGAKPSAAASRKAGHRPSGSASPSASASPSGDPTSSFSMSPDASSEVAPAAAEPSDDGLPPWVAPVAIGLLFAAAAGTAVVRRRRGTPGP